MSFKYEYGCVMFKCDIINWGKIISTIKESDVYNNETDDYGLEYDPHITALFGILPDKTKPEDVKSFMQMNFTKPKVDDIKIVAISFFENPEFDVLKFDVVSPYLQNVNTELCNNFEYHNEYPDYHPHMTIAYLKKGRGARYAKELSEHRDVVISNIEYSFPKDESAEEKRSIFFKLEDNV